MENLSLNTLVFFIIILLVMIKTYKRTTLQRPEQNHLKLSFCDFIITFVMFHHSVHVSINGHPSQFIFNIFSITSINPYGLKRVNAVSSSPQHLVSTCGSGKKKLVTND